MTQEHYILVIIAMAACMCFILLCIIASYLGRMHENQEEFMAMWTFHDNRGQGYTPTGREEDNQIPDYRTRFIGEPPAGDSVMQDS